MATIYVLARDKLEQVRTMLASDSVFDAEADHLLGLAIRRMTELDQLAMTGLAPDREEGHGKAHILMPWLNRH